MPRPLLALCDGGSTCVNSSKIFGSIAASMPEPLSATSTTADSPSRRSRSVDLAAGRRVFGGVVQEIADHLREPGRVGVDRQRLGRDFEDKIVRAGLDQRPAEVDRRLAASRRSNGALRNSTLPWPMRDTSSRSSISRTRCAICRSITSRVARARSGSRSSPSSRRPFFKRRQGIAQFVGEDGEELVLAAVGLLQRQRVGFQFLVLRGDLLALAGQLEEHVGLAPEDVGLDRLLQEIDGAGLIAAEAPAPVGDAGRDEDDRHPPRALRAAHRLGQLEAVHVRHLHVEQRQRDVVGQQQFQGLDARSRLQERQARRGAAARRARRGSVRDRRPAGNARAAARSS